MVFPEIENFPRIYLVQKEYKKWEKETYNVLKYVSGRCTSHFLLVSAHNHDYRTLGHACKSKTNNIQKSQ